MGGPAAGAATRGRVESLRSALCRILAARGLALDPARSSRVDTGKDAEQLATWVEPAATASAIEQVFTA